MKNTLLTLIILSLLVLGGYLLATVGKSNYDATIASQDAKIFLHKLENK